MNVGLLVQVGKIYRIHIVKGKPIFRGWEMGPGLTVAKQTETHMFVKCRSHYSWSGRAGVSTKISVPTQYWKLSITPMPKQEGVWEAKVEDALIAGKKITAIRKFLADEPNTALADLLAGVDN